MKYVKHVSLLFVLFACIAMSSSVVARTVLYTFEGVFENAASAPFVIGDVFEGYVEYETYVPPGGTGPISVTFYSVTVNKGAQDAQTIDLDDFTYLNLSILSGTSELDTGNEALLVNAYGVGPTLDGYDLYWMKLTFDKSNGIYSFSMRFEAGNEGAYGSITGGTIMGYPAPSLVPSFTCYGFEPPLGNGLIAVREHVPVKKPKKKEKKVKPVVVPVKFRLKDEATDTWITGDMLEGIGFPQMIPSVLSYDINVPSLDPSEFMLPSSEAPEIRDGVFWWNYEEKVWQYNWGVKEDWSSSILEVFPFSPDRTAYTIDDSCRASVLLK